MNPLSSSPLELVDAALLEHNPFAQPPTVTANNVWDKGFPDVESLNPHASDAVFKALDDIRKNKYLATSILITAQNGTGKSHIIGRIRHRLQDLGSAFFILANKFTNLNQVKAGFQQLLAESLSKTGSQGTSQWQELATSIVNEVLSAQNPDNKPFAPKDLVARLQKIQDESKRTALINNIVKKSRSVRSVQDPDIIRAILLTLIDEESAYAMNWLAGKELAQYKANDLRLPTQNQSFDTVLQILEIISFYNSLVLCFDELDLPECDDTGYSKAQVIAGFVKELAENLKRGVILSVMMPGTWEEKVLALPAAVANKISMFGDPLDLKNLDPKTTVDLVSFFLKDYYEARDLIPPTPTYPFEISQLQAISREKPTVQNVLKWCRDNCKPVVGTDPKIIDVQLDAVEQAIISELSEDLGVLVDDNYYLADSLLFNFEHLVGSTIEGFKITQVTPYVTKWKKKDAYLNFKIVGQDKDTNICIGIAVLQNEGGKSLGAGLRRLLDSKGDYELSRGCLVRSKRKTMAKNFHANYVTPLVNGGGEFVDLLEEQIKPLIAIRSVHRKRESDYQISESDIFRFICERGEKYQLGIHSLLLKEILSAPSYQVPTNLKEEPDAIEDEVHTNNSMPFNKDSNSDQDMNDAFSDNFDYLIENESTIMSEASQELTELLI